MPIFIFLKKSINYLYREVVLYAIWHFSSYFPLFPTLMFTKIRRVTWKMMGAHIGDNCMFGYGIYLDVSGLRRLFIGNNVRIAAETLILLHRRDVKEYYRGMNPHLLPMNQYEIHICDNVQIGMRVVIMPGVTIGEGAVIAANSVVTRDVAPYAIVAGSPAKEIRIVKTKERDE